jgi:hypothetical protein
MKKKKVETVRGLRPLLCFTNILPKHPFSGLVVASLHNAAWFYTAMKHITTTNAMLVATPFVTCEHQLSVKFINFFY